MPGLWNMLKYRRRRELKDPSTYKKIGVRFMKQVEEEAAVAKGLKEKEVYNKVGAGALKKEFRPVREDRPKGENPAVKKLLDLAGVPQMDKEELETLEVAGGDFVEWCRRLSRTKRFKIMVLKAAQTEKSVLNKIMEYAAGKPPQAPAPMPGNGKMVIVWGDDPQQQPKRVEGMIDQTQTKVEQTDKSIIDIPAGDVKMVIN